MAEEGQALSLGTAIGLGYKTKDIGPQLLKFQAEQLAAGSARKAAAHKQKQSEYDKIYNDIIKIDSSFAHKGVKGLLDKDTTEAINKLNKGIQEGASPQELMSTLYDYTTKVNFRKIQSKERDAIEKDNYEGAPVPQILIDAAGRTQDGDFALIGDEKLTMEAMGISQNTNPGTIGYQALPKEGAETALNTIDFSIPALQGMADVKKEVRTVTGEKGYQDVVTTNYIPSVDVYKNLLEGELSKQNQLAAEVVRIAKAEGKNESTLLMELINKAKAEGRDGYTPGQLLKEKVVDYYVTNKFPTWQQQKTKAVQMTANVPVRSSGGERGNNNPPDPSEAPIYQSEFVSAPLLDFMNTKKELKLILDGKLDSEIIELFNNPSKIQSAKAREQMETIKEAWDTAKGPPTTRYYSAQVSAGGEDIKLKNGATIKVDQLYFVPDPTKKGGGTFHAKGSANVMQDGLNVSVQNKDYILDVDDIQTIQSKSGGTGGAVYKNAIINWDKSAKANQVPTIRGYVESLKTGRTTTRRTTPSAGGTIPISGVGGN
jgi:hypothetical protein